jgi:hypothetical protein
MGVSFVCPNCRRRVDPVSANAEMSTATKLWQHKDCAVEPAKQPAPPEQPGTERRKRPRR